MMDDKGPSINYVTRISQFFYPSPVLVTGGHISETPYLVWHHIFCNLLNSHRLTKFLHLYELVRHRIVVNIECHYVYIG